MSKNAIKCFAISFAVLMSSAALSGCKEDKAVALQEAASEAVDRVDRHNADIAAKNAVRSQIK